MSYYIKKIDKSMMMMAIIHILLGIIVSGRKEIGTIWGYGSFLYGLFNIVKYGNRNDEASIFASYMVGIEVLLRSVGASVLWEFGKYSTITLLIVGMMRENLKYLKINFLSMIYFFSLIPSIFIIPDHPFSYIRDMISGNLSGPFCLFISFLYFRQRKFSKQTLTYVFRTLILPIISLITLILVRVPSFQNLTFSSEANFEMSAGYGPNQVSTILGVSLIIIGLAKILYIKIFRNQIFDYFFLLFSIGLALLTFARGGVIAPFIAITFCYLLSGRVRKIQIQFKGYLSIFILFIGLSYLSLRLTDGLILSRYASLLEMFSPQGTNFIGRIKIMAIDIAIFKDNFLMGVGPGGGHSLRYEYGYGKAVAAHSEFTRMLAEHGIFGFFSLFSIIALSYNEYKNRVDYNKILLACLSLFTILTMFHSALRLALPGFIYGLSYVVLNFDRK